MSCLKATTLDNTAENLRNQGTKMVEDRKAKPWNWESLEVLGNTWSTLGPKTMGTMTMKTCHRSMHCTSGIAGTMGRHNNHPWKCLISGREILDTERIQPLQTGHLEQRISRTIELESWPLQLHLSSTEGRQSQILWLKWLGGSHRTIQSLLLVPDLPDSVQALKSMLSATFQTKPGEFSQGH